jgi:hypothetical protein
MLPPDAVPLTVRDAVPAAVAKKEDLQPAVPKSFAGIWQAEGGLRESAGSRRAVEENQVLELFEIG